VTKNKTSVSMKVYGLAQTMFFPFSGMKSAVK